MNVIIRNYKYRLYPTKKQGRLLDTLLGQMQTVYNDALNERRWAWQRSRKSISLYDQQARFTVERHKFPEETSMLNASSTKWILRRLDKAYQEFYKGRRGLPRFKGRNRFKSVDYTYGDGCKVKGGRLYIQHVGNIKIRLHRPVPGEATIKRAIIKRQIDKWCVCLMLEFPDPEPPESDKPVVGIDVGLHSLLALSNGEIIENPRWLRQSLAKLRVAQRRLARRKKGSNRRRKAAVQVAKLYEHIANQRRDFWHKTTTDLINRFGGFAIEDLNLSFMTRNGSLSLSAHDAALGEFRQMLEYKAESAGIQVTAVNPRNTSQECSGCGVIVRKGLKVRTHHCSDCGLTLDRDVNAALNILMRSDLSVRAITWPVAACVALEVPPNSGENGVTRTISQNPLAITPPLLPS
jgi:putative transposase